MTRPTGWLILLTLLLPCGTASAQTAPGPATEKPGGPPPPPLFPNHRRGFYTNSDKLDVIDATPQSPPLETDDPGVPDPGEFEINVLTKADLGTDVRSINVASVDANYGLMLKGWGHDLPTQLKFEFPITAARQTGNPYAIGLGNYEFGLKLNFYNDENAGVRLSLYPQMEFSTGSGVKKGVAEAGQTLTLPILVSHETKHLTLVGNAGFDIAMHDPSRSTTVDFGVGLGRALFRKLALMGDIRTSSSVDFRKDRLVSADVGFIYGVRKSIWYARVGHSLYSDDGHHTYLAFGMKVTIDTKHPTVLKTP